MKAASQSLKMNGTQIEPTPRSIMLNTLGLMVDDFKYRSKENLIETMVGVRDLVIDWLESKEASALKYKKEQANIRRRAEHMDRAAVVKMVYNEVLRFENLGGLRGFGAFNK